MTDVYQKELMEEMQRLKFECCSKDDILGFVEKLLLFSEKLVNRVHIMENKLQVLEQRQDFLIAENERLLSQLKVVISRSRENPQEALEILLQLVRESSEKKPGMIN